MHIKLMEFLIDMNEESIRRMQMRKRMKYLLREKEIGYRVSQCQQPNTQMTLNDDDDESYCDSSSNLLSQTLIAPLMLFYWMNPM